MYDGSSHWHSNFSTAPQVVSKPAMVRPKILRDKTAKSAPQVLSRQQVYEPFFEENSLVMSAPVQDAGKGKKKDTEKLWVDVDDSLNEETSKGETRVTGSF